MEPQGYEIYVYIKGYIYLILPTVTQLFMRGGNGLILGLR